MDLFERKHVHELWQSRKANILSSYNTKEGLTIRSSYLDGANIIESTPTTLTTQVKHRLEQIDNFADGHIKEIKNLSQSDYIKKIEQLNVALRNSWNSEQRVKTLKIAIQCAKLLADVSVLRFYPSKFVLVTEILDHFGRLVHARIRDKSNDSYGLVPVIETCRNWFLKIASIRELVPRFYVELAVLKTCGVLHMDLNPLSTSTAFGPDGELIRYDGLMEFYCDSLLRLSEVIKGIGNPIVALYARTHLVQTASIILTHLDPIPIYENNLRASISLYRQLSRSVVKSILIAQNLHMTDIYHIMAPGFEWILCCSSYGMNQGVLETVNENVVSELMTVSPTTTHHAALLIAFLRTMPTDFIVSRYVQFLEIVKQVTQSTCQADPCSSLISQILQSFGEALNKSCKAVLLIKTEKRRVILADVLRIMSILEGTKDYLPCAQIWITYSSQYLSSRDIDVMLGKIIDQIQSNRGNDLYDVFVRLVGEDKTFDYYSSLYTLDNFSLAISMIHKESIRVKTCKVIVESFLDSVYRANKSGAAPDEDMGDLLDFAIARSNSKVCDVESKGNIDKDIAISDPLMINFITQSCVTIHNSIGPFTFEDERRQISNRIISFLRLVSFGIDLNSSLDYFTDCRASFEKLEQVIVYLIHRVNQLSMYCRQLIGRNRNRTPNFIKSCLVYVFITIPGLGNQQDKLMLWLEGTQVALINMSYSQSDSFITEILCELKLMVASKTSTKFIADYVKNLLSTFITYTEFIDLRHKLDLIMIAESIDDETLRQARSDLQLPHNVGELENK